MNIPLFVAGLILILIVLGDAFETMVLPRRVTRRGRHACQPEDSGMKKGRIATARTVHQTEDNHSDEGGFYEN